MRQGLQGSLQSNSNNPSFAEAAPELRTAHGTVIGVTSNGSTALEACVPGCLQVIMCVRSVRLAAQHVLPLSLPLPKVRNHNAKRREAGVERVGYSMAVKATREEELKRTEYPIPTAGPSRQFGVRWGEVRGVVACGGRSGRFCVGGNETCEHRTAFARATYPVQVQRVLSDFVDPELVHCQHRVTGYTEAPDEGLVRLHFKVRWGPRRQ